MRREFRERCSKKLIRDGHVPLVVTRESISNVLEGIEADLKWDREFVPGKNLYWPKSICPLTHTVLARSYSVLARGRSAPPLRRSVREPESVILY